MFLDRMMDYRTEQAEKLKNNPKLTIGDVTTVNLTIIKGGLQSNVVPSSLRALFDCRLAIDVDHNAFEEMVSYETIKFNVVVRLGHSETIPDKIRCLMHFLACIFKEIFVYETKAVESHNVVEMIC